jgi:hypothetical protein
METGNDIGGVLMRGIQGHDCLESADEYIELRWRQILDVLATLERVILKGL